MHPLLIGKKYCLRLPDGRALGHVHIERLDDSWAEGPWVPAPAFEEFRQLFEREAQMRNDQVIPLWEETANAIADLGIQVIEEGQGVSHPQMRIFVDGNEAIIGPPLEAG
jgi:hypothetical protein